jgi:hypothetical protein
VNSTAASGSVFRVWLHGKACWCGAPVPQRQRKALKLALNFLFKELSKITVFYWRAIVCCHTSMFPGASSALTLYMTGLSLEALLSNTQANENGPGHWKADYSTRHLGTSPI